ncbi:MAG: hypothetical protein QOI40_3421, partial [Alphaproteobacteria bacterium]|nr:hypothetical protein [Alphaproteobacteria bacterium]
ICPTSADRIDFRGYCAVRTAWTAENGVRVEADFVSGFNAIWVVQFCTKKYFALR